MKVSFISLGCAKNLVNAEQMMALVKAAGHTIVGDPEGCDAVVVNTCGFIETAKSEAIDTILEMARLKEEGKLRKILVTGCLSQRYQDELLEELPEVDGVLGTGSYTDVVPALEAMLEGDQPTFFGDIDHTIEDGARILSTPAYTAYLKIAEGCDNRCSYCIIPYLRGRYRSRTFESLLEEAKGLAEQGVQELIVVAQDITRYGTDLYGRRGWAELLEALCKLPFHWIRLHYLYPDEVDDALLDVIASQPKILHYIDIPIQHANDKLLKAMNRRGTKAEISALLRRMREKMPDLVLRTSIIVGLPGEGEAEFEELCQFMAEHEFQRAGVFPFSPEEGTPAAEMENQVDRDVALRRAELLIDVQSRVMDRWNESRLGTVMEVLCEGFDSNMGCYAGRPLPTPPMWTATCISPPLGWCRGSFVPVRITGVSDGDLTGEIED